MSAARVSKPLGPTRILLVDDHEIVRRGLRSLLESHPGFEICGEACDGRIALALAEESKPDIIVMDVSLPELNGFESTRQILQGAHRPGVIILTMHDSEQIVREVVLAGARGYVLKSDAGRDLITAIDAVRAGRSFFTSRVAAMAVAAARGTSSQRPRRPRGELTRREREVLQLLAEGRTNKEVAAALSISVKTAETHRARMMRKLQLASLADLVRYAIRNKYIEA